MRLLIPAATIAFAVLLTQAPSADAGPVPTLIATETDFFSQPGFTENLGIAPTGDPTSNPLELGDLTLSTGGHNKTAQALYESLRGDRKPLGDVNYWWDLD